MPVDLRIQFKDGSQQDMSLPVETGEEIQNGHLKFRRQKKFRL
jgi:hypothetical protein